MATLRELMAMGVPAGLGHMLGTQRLTTVAAQGSTQATSTKLKTNFAILTTSAAGQGVMLREARGMAPHTFYNLGPSDVLIYPAFGEQINAAGVNGPVTLPVGQSAILLAAAVWWLGVIGGGAGAVVPVPTPDLIISHNSSAVLLPIPATWAGTEIRLVGSDGANDANMLVDSFGNVGSLGLRRAGGTLAAPAPLADGDGIGVISARGYLPGGFSSERSARMHFRADGAFSGTNAAAVIAFEQVLSNSLGPGVEVARLQNGGLVIGSPTGGSRGLGSINSPAFYQNGVLVTGGSGGAAFDAVTGGISASGSNQATAAPLAAANSLNVVITVAAGAGVALAAAPPAGGHCLVRNSSTNPLLCYPAVGGAINTQTANAPIYIAANTTAYLEAVSASQWVTWP